MGLNVTELSLRRSNTGEVVALFSVIEPVPNASFATEVRSVPALTVVPPAYVLVVVRIVVPPMPAWTKDPLPVIAAPLKSVDRRSALSWRRIVVEVSQYVLEALRRDEEFVLYRGEHSDQPGSPSVLLLAPASMQPALGSIRKIEHEYSLRDELDSSWAVRPLALSDQPGQMTLVLEDPGGETLD